MPPLVVEGITDAVFFCELLKQHLSEVTITTADQFGRRGIPASDSGFHANGSKLELEFKNQDPGAEGGIGQIPKAVKGLLSRGGVTQLVVAQDLDAHSPNEIVESLRDSVADLLGGPVETVTEEMFRVQNAKLPEDQIPKGHWVAVGVIPMGLPDDPDLDALGITCHAMEDYLIKLLLLDDTLRPDVPILQDLLTGLLSTARAQPYNISFDSSKQVFQLIKSIIKRYNDTGIVRWLFERADRDILLSVTTPLLGRLEQAIAT